MNELESLNHTRWTLAGVKEHRYYYDASNRLTNVQNSAGATVIGLAYLRESPSYTGGS